MTTDHCIWGGVGSDVDESSDNSSHPSTKGTMKPSLNGITFHEGSASSNHSDSGQGSSPSLSFALEARRDGYEGAAMPPDKPAQPPAPPRLSDEAKQLLHANGECKPCLYLDTKTGCMNGDDCSFCHFPHARKHRPRPSKAKRNQCKQLIDILQTSFEPGTNEYATVQNHLASQSSYMRALLNKTDSRVAAPSQEQPREHVPENHEASSQLNDLLSRMALNPEAQASASGGQVLHGLQLRQLPPDPQLQWFAGGRMPLM